MTDREQDVLNAEKKIDASAERVMELPEGTAGYQREVFALIEQIYLYLNLSGGKYGDKGLEIVEAVHDCLKYYDPRKGPFRHYFRAVLRRRLSEEEAPAAARQRGGIVLPRRDRQRIKAIIAISHKMQCPLDSERLPAVAAELLQESQAEIRRLLSANAMATIAPEAGGAGQEERLASIPSALRLEENVLDRVRAGELFRELDRAFRGCRPAQKAVVSKLLTAKLLTELPDLVEEQALARYGFWDADIYRCYLDSGKVPTAREISAALGRNEASTSRTLHDFLSRVDPEGSGKP